MIPFDVDLFRSEFCDLCGGLITTKFHNDPRLKLPGYELVEFCLCDERRLPPDSFAELRIWQILNGNDADDYAKKYF